MIQIRRQNERDRPERYSMNTILDAVSQNRIDFVKNAVYRGFDYRQHYGVFGNTLLISAVLCKRIEIVKFLVESMNEKDITKNFEGKTGLMYACSKGFASIARVLASSDNIDIQDNSGMTALLISYSTGNYGISKMLLRRGANYNQVAQNGFYINRDFVDDVLRPRQNLSRIITLRPPQLVSMSVTRTVEPIVKVKKEFTKPRDSILKTIIKTEFIDKNEVCPISYDTLTFDNIAITSCYHAFDKNAITCWNINNNKCPVCREECVVWTI